MTSPTWFWFQDVVPPLAFRKLIHNSFGACPATFICVQLPCDNFRQGPGQVAWPLLQPGAWQATMPLPLHAKQTLSSCPGPIACEGFGVAGALASGAEAVLATSDVDCFPQPPKMSAARTQAHAGDRRTIGVQTGEDLFIRCAEE